MAHPRKDLNGAPTAAIARDLVEILDEHQSRRPVLGEPAIARVAHNGQRPGARIAAAKSANALEGPKRSLLHDVFGVDAAPGQPPGQPKSIDKVREEHLGKAILICRVAHIQPVEAALPSNVAPFQGVTMIFPVICGWMAQKYSMVPAVGKVWVKVSFVSRALERNAPFFSETT